MNDEGRFQFSTIMESKTDHIPCIICGKPIREKTDYMGDRAGFVAHVDCVGESPLFLTRENSKVDPDHYRYSDPLSLYSNLSKIEIKNGNTGKQILLTFEIVLSRKMEDLVAGLGINVDDFFPGEDEEYPKYKQAELNSGLLCESKLFLEWLHFDATGEFDRIVEIGHVWAKTVKIINRKVQEKNITILSMQVYVEKQDFDLLKSAYWDLGNIVIFKIRAAERKNDQQELPFSQEQEFLEKGKALAKELKDMGVTKVEKTAKGIVVHAEVDKMSQEAQDMSRELDEQMQEAA